MSNEIIFDAKIGDTFEEYEIALEVESAPDVWQPISLVGASARMQLRKDKDSPVAFEFSTANNRLEIELPNKIKLVKIQQFPRIEPWNYQTDIEVTYANGDVETFLENKLFNVVSDVTH